MSSAFKTEAACQEAQGARRPNSNPATAHSPQNIAGDDLPHPRQMPLDEVDEASMESFPCSDPPSYTACHI